MRREPYTEVGISRIPCQRCGEPSSYQWKICATGNKWAGVCVECDIALNELVVKFMGLPEDMLKAYAAAKRALHNPRNSKRSKVARGEALTMHRGR